MIDLKVEQSTNDHSSSKQRNEEETPLSTGRKRWSRWARGSQRIRESNERRQAETTDHLHQGVRV